MGMTDKCSVCGKYLAMEDFVMHGPCAVAEIARLQKRHDDVVAMVKRWVKTGNSNFDLYYNSITEIDEISPTRESMAFWNGTGDTASSILTEIENMGEKT